MADRPAVSVVIPAYNAASFIDETLDSVAAQTRPAEEIVVVDDGSADDTAARIEAWQARHRLPLRLIRQENKGPPAARNVGIRAAAGPLVALLDADDLFFPRTLAKLRGAFDAVPGLGLSFAKMENFDARGTVYPDYFAPTRVFEVPVGEGPDGLRVMQECAFSTLILGSFIPCNCCLFRKEDAIAIGLFDETLRNAEDRDFFARLSKRVGFAYYDEILARRRVHGENSSLGRNSARSSYYTHRMLAKLFRMAAELDLTAVEFRALEAALARSEDSYLYAASRMGLSRYFDAVREVRAQSDPGRRIRIKGMIAAAWHSVAGSRADDFVKL